MSRNWQGLPLPWWGDQMDLRRHTRRSYTRRECPKKGEKQENVVGERRYEQDAIEPQTRA